MRGGARARGAGGARFLPNQLANLAAWYRADNVVLNAGNVQTWPDLTLTSAHDLAQGTAGTRPIWVASDAGYGGQPSLDTRTGRWMSTGAGVFSLAVPCTYYWVGHTTSALAAVLTGGGAAGNHENGSNSRPSYTFAGTVLSSPANDADVANVRCSVLNGASSAIYVSDSQTAKASGAAGSNTLTQLFMGATNAAGAPWNGFVTELVIYTGAHDAATRQRVMRYLGQRYNLAVV